MDQPLSSATLVGAETISLSSITTAHGLRLSVTRTWGGRTLPVDSVAWRALRVEILLRDNRTCSSCGYICPNLNGRGLQIDHRDGDASNNDLTNLRIHCLPCEAIRHCGFAGVKKWLQLWNSDMEQVEIVRRTREIFETSGRMPSIQEVDPLATSSEIGILDLANELMETDWEALTEEYKGVRGFFTEHARGRFAVTSAIGPDHVQPSNSSDTQAAKILEIEHSRPWIRFRPEVHSTLHKFLTEWPPSSTSQSQVAWICVDNNRLQPDEAPTNIYSIGQAWTDICASRQPAVADLDELARRFNKLTGKWMVFAETDRVDFLWSRIASATHAGTLGISAKVSPLDDSGSHVICVYTHDYTDSIDVRKVRKGLYRLGVKERIGYKPDIYTNCRVYKDNAWGILPSRYHE